MYTCTRVPGYNYFSLVRGLHVWPHVHSLYMYMYRKVVRDPDVHVTKVSLEGKRWQFVDGRCGLCLILCFGLCLILLYFCRCVYVHCMCVMYIFWFAARKNKQRRQTAKSAKRMSNNFSNNAKKWCQILHCNNNTWMCTHVMQQFKSNF